MTRFTILPGEGVRILDWPRAITPRSKRLGSRSHCPAHMNCSDSKAGRRCKDSKWHRLCIKHEAERFNKEAR